MAEGSPADVIVRHTIFWGLGEGSEVVQDEETDLEDPSVYLKGQSHLENLGTG